MEFSIPVDPSSCNRRARLKARLAARAYIDSMFVASILPPASHPSPSVCRPTQLPISLPTNPTPRCICLAFAAPIDANRQLPWQFPVLAAKSQVLPPEIVSASNSQLPKAIRTLRISEWQSLAGGAHVVHIVLPCGRSGGSYCSPEYYLIFRR